MAPSKDMRASARRNVFEGIVALLESPTGHDQIPRIPSDVSSGIRQILGFCCVQFSFVRAEAVWPDAGTHTLQRTKYLQ